MKKVFTFLVPMAIGIFLTATVWAQSPEKMSYQAVIRDASDNLMTDTQEGKQISILQGSTSGMAVYVETQTPTTNANGLVSLEIGTGTTSDDFSAIDWANGPYFIKTETAPEFGAWDKSTGISITESQISDLDHFTTADETDPVYGSSEATGIIGADTNTWNNKPDQLTAGTGIDITGNPISATRSVTTYSVGDFAQGGIVFWVDETGQHGLVCAKTDQDGGSGIRWYAGTYTWTMAKGDGPYAGELNTAIIIANQGNGDGSTYAARICNELQVTEGSKTYGDWYLPSKEELNLMYQNKATIDAIAEANGGSSFASAYYYSSTEYSSYSVWLQNFGNSFQDYYAKDYVGRVRAIRAF